MKKTKMQALIAYVLTSLGIQSLPKGDDGKLALSEEQEKTLGTFFPGEKLDAAKAKLDEFLAEEQGADNEKTAEIEKANQLLAAVLDDEQEESPATLDQRAERAVQVIHNQEAQINTLMNTAEPEAAQRGSGVRNALVGAALAASLSTPTHLFGRNAQANVAMFAFEGRNWNMRAAGMSAAKTDFTDVSTITRLSQDLKDYQINNPNFLRDLITDDYALPSFWPNRTGVLDYVQDAVVDIGNVTQARKPDWTPGFEMWIEAEKARIYRIQIDLEFDGYQLQEMENSWLNTIFNFDGSSPYKHSFIAYLIKKIYEKARQEDNEGAWNGIYAPNIKGIKTKGHYLNAQSGLRHQLFMHRDVNGKIAPFSFKGGRFSCSNANDYLKAFIESLPLAVRNATGMKLYMSPSNLVKTQEDYKLKNALHNDYTGNKLNYVEGYPNIQFVTDIRLEGSNLMFITGADNIEVLNYIEAEKAIFRMEELKRNSYIHADYRFGCRFVFSGFKLPADSNYRGIAQFVWVNDEPIFPDTVSVPLFGSPLSTPVEINYNRLHVHPELVADVKTLTGLRPGMVVEITGTPLMTTASKLKKKTATVGNLDLTEDFDPKTMYKLVMVIQADGTFKEVARVADFPSGAPASAGFDDPIFDVADGLVQQYKGDDAELTDILGGTDGTEITIKGSASGTLTVKSIAGKTVLGSDAALSDGKSLTLANMGGVWYETARV